MSGNDKLTNVCKKCGIDASAPGGISNIDNSGWYCQKHKPGYFWEDWGDFLIGLAIGISLTNFVFVIIGGC